VTRSGARRRYESTTLLPTILIVDDTEDNRDLYAMILEHLGYPIATAVDGQEGIERARELNPAVILMDLAMPNVDGFEATRQIRAMSGLPVQNAFIMAVTAFTDSLSAQRALAAGCDEVVTKPCSPSALVKRVESALDAVIHTTRSA